MSVLVQPVIGDTPSTEVELLRRQNNVLVQIITDIKAAVAASSDYGTLKTGIAAVNVSAMRTIELTVPVPLPPLLPTHG